MQRDCKSCGSPFVVSINERRPKETCSPGCRKKIYFDKMRREDPEKLRELNKLKKRKHIESLRKQGRLQDFRRNKDLRKKYGISLAEWEFLFDSQGRTCAICAKPENGHRFATDHCHQTGRVRGILCHGCNSRLAHVELVGWLESATAYLDRTSSFG